MARLNTAGATSLCILLLGTTALHADVTAQQVWDSWQKQYADYGYQVTTGGASQSGDTLVISDLKLSNTVEGSTFEMTVPEMRLREVGDGTVEVTGSQEIDAQANSKPEGQPALEMAIKITQANAAAIVSGTPEAMSYDLTAPEIVAELDQKVAGPGDDKSVPVKVWASLSGLNGHYLVTADAGRTIQSSVKASAVKFTASGADPETGNTFNFNGSVANLDGSGTSFLPEGVDMKDFGAALGKGLKITSKMTYGASDYTLEATAPEGPTTIKGSAQSGGLDGTFAADGVRYAVTGDAAAISATTTQFPIPIEATLDKTEFDFAIPLAAGDAPRPFVAKLGLVGLAISDQLWGMLDPQNHLGHDPATLVIDLSGTAKPLIDLYSPEAAKSAAPPIEIDSLDVNKLKLTVAGADLDGKGAMTFDNSTGMPMPVGAIDLQLAGANKVMDGLTAMGLMPQDQAMFVRMMMGLYAVPAGDDQMTSKIEFKQGGEILANGQRIK